MSKQNDKKHLQKNATNNEDPPPKIVIEGPSHENLQNAGFPFIDAEVKPTNFNNFSEKSERNNCANEWEDLKSMEHPAMRRKNSISLPNLDEMKILQEAQQFNNSTSNEVESDDELDGICGSKNNVRRKSVLGPNPKMLSPPEPDDFSSTNNSPANSITSVNSIASLLREKIQNLPQTIRKKKTNDYKIKVFVVFLFLTIVVLICCAYFLYHQKILAKAYFDKIKFNKNTRIMKIYNNNGVEIIHAQLGASLNYDEALQCLPQDERHDGSICLEWMNQARLYLHFYRLHDNVRCYNLKWLSLNDNVSPTDCFEMSPGVHWYGGGQTQESAWPLEKGVHDFQPFVTGDVEHHEWGNVLKRHFINSKGAAILIDERAPLYISIRNREKKEFCLRAKYDDFAFVNRFTITPELNYSICTGANMSDTYLQMSERTLWDGLKMEDADIDNLLTEPLWEITSDDKEKLTEETVSNFTSEVIALGTLKQGHVLINEFWQNQVGDFQVDEKRFPTLDETIDMLIRRGFRVVFSIQPFISTESFNFAEAVRKRLLVSERFSDRRIPALSRFKTLQSAGVLDVTNNRTIPWLIEKLKAVITKYKFNSFYVELGDAYKMPHYYQCEKPLINPDQYKTIFMNRIQKAVNIFGVSHAIERPRSPIFVSLPRFESSWDGLRRVIPTILTYGIIGYPFLIPGAVGGDYQSINNTKHTDSLVTNSSLSDKELYIRWLQLATFLPVVKYNRLPSSYGDKKVLDSAISLAILRQNKVKPLLKKYARVSLNFGLPIIRPLWMLDPNDPSCHTVMDEFSIGDDLIVAPILHFGAKEREVYLPAGVWKDSKDGSLRKGNRWIHDYRAEDQIAFFEKMPDDTRF